MQLWSSSGRRHLQPQGAPQFNLLGRHPHTHPFPHPHAPPPWVIIIIPSQIILPLGPHPATHSCLRRLSASASTLISSTGVCASSMFQPCLVKPAHLLYPAFELHCYCTFPFPLPPLPTALVATDLVCHNTLLVLCKPVFLRFYCIASRCLATSHSSLTLSRASGLLGKPMLRVCVGITVSTLWLALETSNTCMELLSIACIAKTSCDFLTPCSNTLNVECKSSRLR